MPELTFTIMSRVTTTCSFLTVAAFGAAAQGAKHFKHQDVFTVFAFALGTSSAVGISYLINPDYLAKTKTLSNRMSITSTLASFAFIGAQIANFKTHYADNPAFYYWMTMAPHILTLLTYAVGRATGANELENVALPLNANSEAEEIEEKPKLQKTSAIMSTGIYAVNILLSCVLANQACKNIYGNTDVNSNNVHIFLSIATVGALTQAALNYTGLHPLRMCKFQSTAKSMFTGILATPIAAGILAYKEPTLATTLFAGFSPIAGAALFGGAAYLAKRAGCLPNEFPINPAANRQVLKV